MALLGNVSHQRSVLPKTPSCVLLNLVAKLDRFDGWLWGGLLDKLHGLSIVFFHFTLIQEKPKRKNKHAIIHFDSFHAYM